MNNKTELNQQEQLAYEQVKQAVARRTALERALTPEVRTHIRELFGLDSMLFAFGDNMDALTACRRDTIRGVVEALEYEADHAEESRTILQEIHAEMTPLPAIN